MSKPKKFINDAEDSVSEFIEGLLLQYPNRIAKLANHHVLLTAERDVARVQLISGGGSGHEPSHAGWLGAGMLGAVVCGGVFASPSVSSVLAAIRAVVVGTGTGENAATAAAGGVLLVVKNYTGDRLNFGTAAERAAQEGIPVRTVVVADDVALPRAKGITGARGVAGTVLVHKVAGAAAAAGQSLDEVAAAARSICERMGSLGVALDSVTVPGADRVNDRLDSETIEIGLGIHGEAGLRQSPLLTSDEVAREMVKTIREHGRVVQKDDGTEEIVPLFEAGDEVCVLVNNLGGTSNFEMSILARSCIRLLEGEEFAVKARRVLVGSYMTSFDMHGASLTIVNVTGQDELVQFLDAPTDAPAWAGCDLWKPNDDLRPSVTEVPEVVVSEEQKKAGTPLPPLAVEGFEEIAKRMLSAAAQKLAESEPLLTEYDTIVGDGDCGITVKRGASEITRRLESGAIPLDHPANMYAALADAVSASMGGTSGVLIEMLLRKMGNTLSQSEGCISAADLAVAFRAGVDTIGLYGGAGVGSRTMMDALVPAAEAAMDDTSGGGCDLAGAAAAARRGADGTAAMKAAHAGRSNYLSESTLEGTPDPGAVAVAIVLEAMVQ